MQAGIHDHRNGAERDTGQEQRRQHGRIIQREHDKFAWLQAFLEQAGVTDDLLAEFCVGQHFVAEVIQGGVAWVISIQ